MARDVTGVEAAERMPAQRQSQSEDPLPEQQPWRSPEDAAGWRTVYRGKGRRRVLANSVVLDLTPEQWAWLSRVAAERNLLVPELLDELIDAARAADERRLARAAKKKDG